MRKRLLTLGTRGTDVALSALDLSGRSFKLDEIYERYGKLVRGRGVGLADHFRSSIRNELQRSSSDCLVFEKENRKLDLYAQVSPGVWAIRDDARPRLLTAANNYGGDLLKVQHTLLVPTDDDDDDDDDKPSRYTNEIGGWAQARIMDAMRLRGAEIIADMSGRRAYDFHFFKGPGRLETSQIMECKGTRRSNGDFALTPNEMTVWGRSRASYWLGVVYNIEIVDGRACGGSAPFITPPPIDNTWRLTDAFRWSLIETVPDLFGVSR